MDAGGRATQDAVAECYSRMGVKPGFSGTQFLPVERPELCEGLGVHFVKNDRGIARYPFSDERPPKLRVLNLKRFIIFSGIKKGHLFRWPFF